MIEIAAVPSEPMFDDAFESMVIQGDVGIAVSKETSDYRLCVSIGKTGDNCMKILLEGEPYRITKCEQISQEEYDSFQSLLANLTARNGMVAADVLDGESFMLKWRTIDGSFGSCCATQSSWSLSGTIGSG